jgi:tRNA dimethylallyltransferase
MTKTTSNIHENHIFIIGGPTAAGKSDFACEIASRIHAEIVNADMGQLYTPLSIGTAKPNWRSEPTIHHLFDIIDEPRDCTVVEYRAMVTSIVQDIMSRGAMPIIVGGSGFYLQSLFFPPVAGPVCAGFNEEPDWNLLNSIDPERARNIHPHDVYRISRALNIWKSTGIKPSTMVRPYKPLAQAQFLWVTRSKKHLNERINQRVIHMIDHGWLEECRNLLGTPWETFIRKKKLIGYCELFDHLEGRATLDDSIAVIQQKTRNYAKRQMTFWRMLKRQLDALVAATPPVVTCEVNLTLDDSRLYINHLLQL